MVGGETASGKQNTIMKSLFSHFPSAQKVLIHYMVSCVLAAYKLTLSIKKEVYTVSVGIKSSFIQPLLKTWKKL